MAELTLGVGKLAASSFLLSSSETYGHSGLLPVTPALDDSDLSLRTAEGDEEAA